MLDVLAFPDRTDSDRAAAPGADLNLMRALAIASSDRTEFVCIGTLRDHRGRPRRCGWHLVLHRPRNGGPEDVWTHLYRVLPEHGDRVLVLLHQALPGDRREALRHSAMATAFGLAK